MVWSKLSRIEVRAGQTGRLQLSLVTKRCATLTYLFATWKMCAGASDQFNQFNGLWRQVFNFLWQLESNETEAIIFVRDE